eukprot:scaffold697_cov320-Prasinococcus_capsulatus_cf.AAC.1
MLPCIASRREGARAQGACGGAVPRVRGGGERGAAGAAAGGGAARGARARAAVPRLPPQPLPHGSHDDPRRRCAPPAPAEQCGACVQRAFASCLCVLQRPCIVVADVARAWQRAAGRGGALPALSAGQGVGGPPRGGHRGGGGRGCGPAAAAAGRRERQQQQHHLRQHRCQRRWRRRDRGRPRRRWHR